MKLLRNSRIFGCLALGLIVATSFLSVTSETRAQAQGSTSIDITLPDVVILHYFSSVDISVSTDGLSTLLGFPGGAVDEGSVTLVGQGFDVDLAMAPSGDPLAALGSSVLALRNAWAVRSMSVAGSTTTSLNIQIDGNTLSHTGGAGQILLTGAEVTDGTSQGGLINFTAPGLFTPLIGDVLLTMDMTSADAAGSYTGGIFTLLATNP